MKVTFPTASSKELIRNPVDNVMHIRLDHDETILTIHQTTEGFQLYYDYGSMVIIPQSNNSVKIRNEKK